MTMMGPMRRNLVVRTRVVCPYRRTERMRSVNVMPGGGLYTSPPSLSRDADSDALSTTDAIPELEFFHLGIGVERLEGENIKCTVRARHWDYEPFDDLTRLLLFAFLLKYRLSRLTTRDPVYIFRLACGEGGKIFGEGQGINVAYMPKSCQHFVSRTREHLPICECRCPRAPCKQSVDERMTPAKHVPMFHTQQQLMTPLNLIILALFESPGRHSRNDGESQGRVVQGNDLERNRVDSDHMIAVFELIVGPSGYVSVGDGVKMVCRHIAMFWEVARDKLLATVRRFRAK